MAGLGWVTLASVQMSYTYMDWVQSECMFEMVACDRHALDRLDLTGLASLDCVEFRAENVAGLDWVKIIYSGWDWAGGKSLVGPACWNGVNDFIAASLKALFHLHQNLLPPFAGPAFHE